MSESRKKIERILDNNYGVNSGVYSTIDSKIQMKINGRGEYTPIFTGGETKETYEKLLRVDMMSNESPDEDEIAQQLFPNIRNIKHDHVLGYYSDLYIGYVTEGDFRVRGSSGGFTSWILAELFRQKKIDGVIHVHSTDPRKKSGKLFEYVVSRSVREIKDGAKSRYYPMELSEVLRIVKNKPGRYAVVGIPEFIMELRLLANNDDAIKERIKYMIGLVCGHQKTTKYAEALAWQHGIKPGNLLGIDFRVKQPHSTAIDYLHEFTGLINGKKISFTKKHKELFGETWAHGFFKSKFSDFTDNAFNEVADIVLGDAWLPEYNSDGMGNNIIIVRHPEIAKLIKKAIKNGSVKLDEVDKETIKNSQLGLIHHIRDELPYRLKSQQQLRHWVPIKRVKPSGKLPFLRKRVQDLRYKMAIRSHKVYAKAVRQDDWHYFEKRMKRLVNLYNFLYKAIGQQKESFSGLRQKLKPRTRVKYLLQHTRKTIRPRTRIKSLTRKAQDRYLDYKYKNAEGAIITLTGYYNYGNIIQRYALQEFLSKEDHNFVSYISEPKASGPDFNGPRFRRVQKTKKFVEKRIKQKPFKLNENFPTYIVGSDQVWRNWGYQNETEDLGYYFLNFVKNSHAKRIAYAVSFGQDNLKDAMVSSEFAEYAKPLVKKFDKISVRENSGGKIIHKTWGAKPQQVCDPSMLLMAEDYDKLIKGSLYKLDQSNPIFVYMLASSEDKTRIVQKITHTTKKKIDNLPLYQIDVLPPVEQWLKNFRDTELVITDSFHGTVFAIINNKPFIVIENTEGGVSRITDLLNQFGLEDRLVVENKADKFDPDKLKSIDWRDVNNKLSDFRKTSGDWLLDALDK